jgi:hypothetical protein
MIAYVRSKSRTKDKVGHLKNKDGQLIIDDQRMGPQLYRPYSLNILVIHWVIGYRHIKRVF